MLETDFLTQEQKNMACAVYLFLLKSKFPQVEKTQYYTKTQNQL